MGITMGIAMSITMGNCIFVGMAIGISMSMGITMGITKGTCIFLGIGIGISISITIGKFGYTMGVVNYGYIPIAVKQ